MGFSIKLGETSVGTTEGLSHPSRSTFDYKGFSVGKLYHQAKWLTSIMPGGFATSEEHIRRRRPQWWWNHDSLLYHENATAHNVPFKWRILGLWERGSASPPCWIALFVLERYASENEIWYTRVSLPKCFSEAFATVHHSKNKTPQYASTGVSDRC